MSRIIFLIAVLIIVNSYVVLEEETIVFLASVLWVDAAGTMIREALTSELEGKGDKIKEVFVWYLTAQRNLEEVLIKKHSIRQDLVQNVVGMYELYIDKFLDTVLKSYAYNYILLSKEERRKDIIERGLLLVNELSKKEMQPVVAQASDRGDVVWLDKAVRGGLLSVTEASR